VLDPAPALIAEPAPPPPVEIPEVSAGRARTGAILMVAGAFVLVLAWIPSELFDLERYLVPKALVLHLVALGLLLLGLVPLRRQEWDAPNLMLAAFVAWSAVTAALATNRWLALSAVGVSFSSAVVFLAARSLPTRLRWRVLGGILAAVVVAAALGVAQAYGVQGAWLSDSRPPGGTFGNRNFLGHVAAIAAPALLMWTVCARRTGTAAVGLTGLSVLVAVIVLTRSRAAWLGGIGGVATALIGLWWVGREGGGARVGRLAAAGVVTLATVAVAVLAPNDLDWRTDSPYASTLTRLAEFQEGSGRGRLIQYENTLGLVRRDPLFGSGPGNWFVDYPLVTTRGDPAFDGSDIIPTNPWPSSDWVALLAERGAVGALLLLLAGAAAVWVMLGEDRERNPNRSACAGGVAGVLTAALICGAFDAVLLLAAPAFLTWAAVGLLLPRGVAPSSGGVPRGAVTAIALGLVLYTAAHATAIALTAESTNTRTLARAALFAPGEHRLQLALGERGRCESARRAARLMPNHPRVERLARGC
jgi:hypothetical protein